jgi:hypothetical protein
MSVLSKTFHDSSNFPFLSFSKAVKYKEEYLRIFLTDGSIPMDNNYALSDGITYPHLFLEIQINRGLSQKRCA